MNNEPLISAEMSLPEFGLKVFVISVLLAIILAATNIYLALKIGVTISASIPASVLAIGILRFFKNSNVLQSNIIQTAASAGEGVAAAVAFVLPAMLFIKSWTGFPYWETMLITMLGGLLGVIFSVPLRRVMLSMPALRFPEGTAIGNVLRISATGGAQMKLLVQGTAVGGIVSLCQTGFQVLAQSFQAWFYAAGTVIGTGLGLGPALFAAGYIIGIEVGLSLLFGVIVGWSIVLPMLGHFYGVPKESSAYLSAMDLWSQHLRFVGVGVMLVGGIWTLCRLLRPVMEGLKLSFVALKQKAQDANLIPRTERDISITWVMGLTVVFSILLLIVLMYYMDASNLFDTTSARWTAGILTIIYVIVIGFMLATVCAYFTGLVGSTNNPLSGILILTVLLLSAIYYVIFYKHLAVYELKIAGIVIMVTAVVATIAAISNENLQDLKAGQMVGATPWRQQIMLGVGVVASALIVGPVLQLLFSAYGMAGIYPHPGMDPSQMLPAPQSSLMASVAMGVLTHHMQWSMIITGGVIAVITIIIDEYLRTKGRALPALAVGLGIYLPPDLMLPIVVGGLISYLVKKNLAKKAKTMGQEKTHNMMQRGVLLACGLVAGNALMGVILAIPFVLKGSADALALVGKGFAPIANIVGLVAIALICYWLYYTSVKAPQENG